MRKKEDENKMKKICLEFMQIDFFVCADAAIPLHILRLFGCSESIHIYMKKI
jgi:hypothetical protein